MNKILTLGALSAAAVTALIMVPIPYLLLGIIISMALIVGLGSLASLLSRQEEENSQAADQKAYTRPYGSRSRIVRGP